MQLNFKRIPFIRSKHIPWIIWGIAGLYYFYDFILRILPSTMTAYFMKNYHVNATGLTFFTASYYLSYTLMQIPAGLLIDRYSIRKTLFASCSLCIVGFAVVHASHFIYVAEAGRFIIGLGCAFAYIGALKVASIWLPKNHFGLASCIIDSLGTVGAIFTEVVLVHITLNSGYQFTTLSLLVLGISIAAIIYFCLHDAPAITDHGKLKEIDTRDRTDVWQKLMTISKNPQIWLIGIVGCLFYLPFSVVGDVWGIPYIENVYRFSPQQAGILMAMFFTGVTVVSPLIGAISDKFQKRILPIKICITIDIVLFSVVIFCPIFFNILIPHGLMYVIFFTMGVVTGIHPLVFALAKENFPNKIAGTVVAGTNTLIMLGGLLFQPLVGLILDISHKSLESNGFQVYAANDYSLALSIIPIALVICLCVLHFIKDTGAELAKKDEFEEQLEKAMLNPEVVYD